MDPEPEAKKRLGQGITSIVTQTLVGWAVIPGMCTRRRSCSTATRT